MAIRYSALVIVLAACCLAGCMEFEETQPLPFTEADSWNSPIVGGQTTTGWDSVVLLSLGGGICTGTLV